MAASDHISGEQLRMFMTARELRAMSSGDEISYGGRDQMVAAHRTALSESGMDVDVRRNGVQEPVEVMHHAGHRVSNGNHRVTAAFDRGPNDLVPVVHHATVEQRDKYQDMRTDAGVRDVNRETYD